MHSWSDSTWPMASATLPGGHESLGPNSFGHMPKTASQAISGGCDGKLTWWDAAAEKPAASSTIEAQKAGSARSRRSPDGKLLASGGNDNRSGCGTSPTARSSAMLRSRATRVQRAVSSGGQFLLSGDLVGVIKQWDVATGKEVAHVRRQAAAYLQGGQQVDFGGVRDWPSAPTASGSPPAGFTKPRIRSEPSTSRSCYCSMGNAEAGATAHRRRHHAGVIWRLRVAGRRHADGREAAAAAADFAFLEAGRRKGLLSASACPAGPRHGPRTPDGLQSGHGPLRSAPENHASPPSRPSRGISAQQVVTQPLSRAAATILAAWYLLDSQQTRPALAVAPADRQPNIVLVLVDDVGREALGCYGGTSYKTPSIHRLAAGGVRLTHAYAMPVCHPTRICLLTGQYPFRLGNPLWGSFPPQAERRTLAQVLKNAGYATAVVGKWQLALLKDDLDQLCRMGFDEYCLFGWHEGPGITIRTSGKTASYGPTSPTDMART